MHCQHPTHLLFIEPHNAPSKYPLEDIYSKSVDLIFSQAIHNEDFNYKGWHSTGFGKFSDNKHYYHPNLPLVTNSLAGYYIRYHRQDITQKQLDWIIKIASIIEKSSDTIFIDFESNDDVYLMIYSIPHKEYSYKPPIITYTKTNKETFDKNILKYSFIEIITKEEWEQSQQQH